VSTAAPLRFSALNPATARWRGHPLLVAWLKQHGLLAENTVTVTVHADQVDVLELRRDAGGRPFPDPQNPDRAATRSRTVPLRSPFPKAIAADVEHPRAR